MFKIIDQAIYKKSSDIHLNEGSYPIFRINGCIEEQNGLKRLDSEFMEAYLALLLKDESESKYKRQKQLDRVINYKDCRLRIHLYRQKGKDSISIRILDKKIYNFKELNLPESLAGFAAYESGLVLITGKTGSGKSTTLSAIINHVNQNQKKKIISLEDPIEFLYQENNSIINQREIGRDVNSYSDGIISALRADPDIIVLGELRDLESIKSAITLSETGHLVFASLHTRNASETINRIIDVFPGEEQNQIRIQLSQVLMAVVCQDLIYSEKLSKRLPICEILIPSRAIRNAIRQVKSSINIEDQILMLSGKNDSQTRSQAVERLIKEDYLDSKLGLKYLERVENHM